MAALRDPAIKLFGRTIPLLDTPPPAGEADKVLSKLTNDVQNNDGIPYSPNEVVNVDARSRSPESSNKNDWKAIKNLKDEKTETDSKSEEVKTESVKTESDGSGQEKLLKKPDKILPCPRCNSMETKFCYYNNYNVNQPRHFCKNCQRYWTAGGTMRNVPVGAGRRKNKHLSHFRHVMIPSDSIVAAHGDVSDLVCHQALPCGPPVPVGTVKGNETVLKFGSDMPLCESMATALDIGEQKNTDFASSASGDNKEEQSCASSVAVSNCLGNGMPDSAVKIEPSGMSGNSSGTALPHMHCYPAGPALMFPWSPGWNNVAALAAARCSTELVHASANGKSNPLSLVAPAMMASPGICAPAVPFPLVPPSFWSCMPGWPNVMWGAPWPGCNSTTSLSNPLSDSTCLGNISPTLGKHARETSLPSEEKTQKNLWVPKTLRIDDPDEAAKSSIWATLGIKPNEKGIFKSFQPKVLKTDETPGSPQVLQANPAAFSRSQSFQEGN